MVGRGGSRGSFIPQAVCRDELREEMIRAEVAGACGLGTNNVVFVPYIFHPQHAHCGKWMQSTEP
jgi:hypothetical protein